MGVRGLITYCKGIIKHADMNAIGFHIGIDVFSLFFLFREKRAEFKIYLQSLLKLNHRLECIMDTRAQKEKKEVVEERKEIRKEASENAKDIQTFTKTAIYDDLDEQQQKILTNYINMKKQDAWCLYKEYVRWFRQMLDELKVPLIYAEEEADTVLSKGNYDVVISSDSDLLIHGVNRLWMPNGRGIQHNEITNTDFMKYIKINKDQLYPMAFLAGCDIQPRRIFRIDEAINLLRFYKTLEGIHKKMPTIITEADLQFYIKLRESAWKD